MRLIVAREAGYLREDIDKVRRAFTRRLSHVLVVGGASAIVVSIAQWQIVVAGALAGVFAIVYGLLFVDVDVTDDQSPRRRPRR